MTRSSEVGKEALAYCTSCKMDLTHIVVAMKGDRIAKAQCKTCNKEHAYKAPKGVTEPGKAPKKATSKKAKAADSGEKQDHSIAAEWEKLMLMHKDTPAKSYTVKTQFALGDKLHHPTFGDGIVGKLIYPNKVEVVFQMDMKILIHGGARV